MPYIKRGTHGEARVSRCWMNVDLLEWRRIKNFSVRDAIKSHATCKTNGLKPSLLAKSFQHAEIYFFKARLQRGSEIAMPVVQRFFWSAHRTQALRHFL